MKKIVNKVFEIVISFLIGYVVLFGGYLVYLDIDFKDIISSKDFAVEKLSEYNKGLERITSYYANVTKYGLLTPYREKNVYTDIDDSIFNDKYNYNLLSNEEKTVYRQLYDAASNYKTEFMIINNNVDVWDVKVKFEDDWPEYYWLSSNNSDVIRCGINSEEYYFKYTDINDNVKDTHQEIEDKATEILSKLKKDDDYEYIKAIHDYIIENVDYVFDSVYNQDLRSSLVYGKSVCAGYSRMFQYLCNKAGYECAYISGYAKGVGGSYGSHAWNRIVIDENYYWTDVTWDYCTSSDKYFLMDDETLKEKHSFEKYIEIIEIPLTVAE